VRFEKETNIAEVRDEETYRRVFKELQVEIDQIRDEAEDLLNRYLDCLIFERTRDDQRIAISKSNTSAQVTKRFLGSDFEMGCIAHKDVIQFRDSWCITSNHVDENGIEVVEERRWPDTSPLIKDDPSIPDCLSWYRHARNAEHPFEEFRNYYNIFEHLAKADPKRTMETLHSMEVTVANGELITNELLGQLFMQGRNAVNHAGRGRDYRLPTRPQDLKEIGALVPFVRDLAEQLLRVHLGR
jgi:hypothetical protein